MKTHYIDFLSGGRVDAQGVEQKTTIYVPYQSADTWNICVRGNDRGSLSVVDLSAATAWRAAVDTNFNHALPPCCRVLDADIDHSAAAAGNLSMTLDSNTSTFLAAIGTQEAVPGWFELAGYNGVGKQIYYFRFAVLLTNCLDPSGGDPPEPAGNFYTKTEIDAMINAKLANTVTIDGVTYAVSITLDNGVPTLTLNPG